MARTRLARHPYNRRRRSKDFKTTTTPARARNTTKRIDTHVSYLRRRAIYTTPQLAVENDSTTNTSPERQANDRLTTNGGSLPHLTDRGCIRIVLEDRGQTKLLGQSRRQSKSIETRKVWRLHDGTFLNLHSPTNDERNCRTLCRLLKFANRRHDRINNRPRVFDLRRVLFEPRVNSAVLIDDGGTEVRPAKISSENQFPIRNISVPHTAPTRLSVSQHSSHARCSWQV